ncbi:hypothetical protein [Chromobacterium violaceum]|uniref:hypothetical protein n=1 Tax=Chromobacterium violaceum TaxID=536 RepID=UPI0012D2BC6F|nr:hypothetical protein [Chromobacterium violaceum]
MYVLQGELIVIWQMDDYGNRLVVAQNDFSGDVYPPGLKRNFCLEVIKREVFCLEAHGAAFLCKWIFSISGGAIAGKEKPTVNGLAGPRVG